MAIEEGESDDTMPCCARCCSSLPAADAVDTPDAVDTQRVGGGRCLLLLLLAPTPRARHPPSHSPAKDAVGARVEDFRTVASIAAPCWCEGRTEKERSEGKPPRPTSTSRQSNPFGLEMSLPAPSSILQSWLGPFLYSFSPATRP